MESRISTRISLLAGLSVFCVAMMVAAHFFGDAAVRQAFVTEDRYAQLADYTQKIETAALALKTSETDFLLHRNSIHAKRHEKASARVITLLDEVPVASVAGTFESAVLDLRDLVREYTAQFRFIVRLYKQLDPDENKGIQGQFRKAVHAVEARIRASGSDRLLAKLLMLRRQEKDFLLRENPKYVERFDRGQAEFVELLARAPVPPGIRQEVTALMGAYGEGFHTWVEISAALHDEIGRLAAISTKLAPMFERFNDMVTAKHAQVRTALEEARALTSKIFIFTGIFVLGLALLFGTIIARSITRPLKAITETVKALAGGGCRRT